MNVKSLNATLGNIDIYLLDQILKGRFEGLNRILDAGCGEGRNLHWFLQHNFSIYGIDENPVSVEYARIICSTLQKGFTKENIHQGLIQNLPYPDSFFDAVISVAVLHFADNHEDFQSMIHEMTRVLKNDGLLFIRLSTLMGMDYQPVVVGNGIYKLNDGNLWYLAEEMQLKEYLNIQRMELLEPFKSVCVHGERSMTTLVLRKKATING